jgi:hypothetical protein
MALRSSRFWIFAVLFLALVAVAVGASSAFRDCVQGHKTQGAENENKEGIATITVTASLWRECTGEFIHGNGEAIIAFFTIILALSTIALWSATGRLYEAGERQFLATFRPRLLVREVTWAKNGVSLTVENVGGNPCTIVESDFLLRSGDPDGRVLRTKGKNSVGRVTLKVGQFLDHVHGFDEGEESFTAGFVGPETLLAGALHDGLTSSVFFLGTIIYQDRLMTRRRMAFLRVCKAKSIRFTRTEHTEDEYADQ